LPIDDVVVLSDAVQAQIANPRLVALTLNGFATTASALAALGLGTLIAWQVRLRTREIGVRLALGATPRQVIGIVMGESILVVAMGVGAGLVAALLLGGFLETLLFEARRAIQPASSTLEPPRRPSRSSARSSQPAAPRGSIPWSPCGTDLSYTQGSRRLPVVEPRVCRATRGMDGAGLKSQACATGFGFSSPVQSTGPGDTRASRVAPCDLGDLCV